MAENAEHHHATDWVLDVSGARFRNSMIRDLPPEKIRIDASRQAVITVSSMQGSEAVFADVDLPGTVGMVIREAMNGRVWDPLVNIDISSKTAPQELELIQTLHEGGFALPVI